MKRIGNAASQDTVSEEEVEGGITNGPKANPNTYKLKVRITTSVLMPNSMETASKVGENDEEAKETPIVVSPNRIVLPSFFFTLQFMGLFGSLGPSQPTILLGQSLGDFSLQPP